LIGDLNFNALLGSIQNRRVPLPIVRAPLLTPEEQAERKEAARILRNEKAKDKRAAAKTQRAALADITNQSITQPIR
jgi:hypothetical protein